MFMLFVSISFVLDGKTQTRFLVEYGFNTAVMTYNIIRHDS